MSIFSYTVQLLLGNKHKFLYPLSQDSWWHWFWVYPHHCNYPHNNPFGCDNDFHLATLQHSRIIWYFGRCESNFCILCTTIMLHKFAFLRCSFPWKKCLLKMGLNAREGINCGGGRGRVGDLSPSVSAWLQGDHPNMYQFNVPQRILFKKNVITGFCQNWKLTCNDFPLYHCHKKWTNDKSTKTCFNFLPFNNRTQITKVFHTAKY